MGTSSNPTKVSTGQLGMATVLLIGVLITAYGYFQGPRTLLYVGLLVTLAGVVYGVLQLIGGTRS